jgi:hypothetical protein
MAWLSRDRVTHPSIANRLSPFLSICSMMFASFHNSRNVVSGAQQLTKRISAMSPFTPGSRSPAAPASPAPPGRPPARTPPARRENDPLLDQQYPSTSVRKVFESVA